MTDDLIALWDRREIGRVRRDARGRLSFVHDEGWGSGAEDCPLSLSMPLGARAHGRAVIEAFLWGLLPDDEQVLARWAAKFQASARNVFALIANVGEDCAGAARFVTPERLNALGEDQGDVVEWLSESDVARRLSTLRADHAAWRLPRDAGRFSLAGAQPKTALLWQEGRWGVPSGRLPTTHILKPPTGQFEGHVENEHLCLALARRLGLPTARSRVARFEDEIAIVIERYDRAPRGKDVLRVHQEDVCQALGVMPTKKYQNEGGPSAAAIVELLRTASTKREVDARTFVAAMGFNWLIAGTDAHAKNFSLLLAGGRVRLAPLYDVASLLPHDQFDLRKIELAMKIGGEYELGQIGARQWRKFARETRMDADELITSLREMAARLPDEASAVRDQVRKEGLKTAVVERLVARLIERARECERSLNIGVS